VCIPRRPSGKTSVIGNNYNILGIAVKLPVPS
jgi:hypothetical protein